MSHQATNWAIRQRGLKPATKIVLWHLADCHNPALGCFPTQAYLADASELSRASINRHLDELEQRGLIRRDTTIDPQTKQQRPTRYVLLMDDAPVSRIETRTQDVGAGFQNETRLPVSQIETIEPEAVSQNDQKPCLKNGDSRVSNCDTNSVREPVREPVKAAQRRASAGGQQIEGEGSFFDRVLDVVGINRNDIPTAGWMPPRAEVIVNRWLTLPEMTRGLALQHIAESRKRRGGPPPGSPAAYDREMAELSAILTAPPLQPAAVEHAIRNVGHTANRPHRALTLEEAQAAIDRGFSGQ